MKYPVFLFFLFLTVSVNAQQAEPEIIQYLSQFQGSSFSIADSVLRKYSYKKPRIVLQELKYGKKGSAFFTKAEYKIRYAGKKYQIWISGNPDIKSIAICPEKRSSLTLAAVTVGETRAASLNLGWKQQAIFLQTYLVSNTTGFKYAINGKRKDLQNNRYSNRKIKFVIIEN
jgi:hypothetical protein